MTEGAEADAAGDTIEFDAARAARIPPLRRASRWMSRSWSLVGVLTALLVVVVVGLAWGAWAAHQHAQDQIPLVSARRVAEPIAKHDEGALRHQIDELQQSAKAADAAAVATTAFFKGWSIDMSSVRIVEQGDDNMYEMAFTARRPTGTRAFIHGSLWPQGETGDPPWKLTQLWVDHGNRHKARMIFPPAT